eukprot:jgi/Ulvmu1/1860/UM012_0016.1
MAVDVTGRHRIGRVIEADTVRDATLACERDVDWQLPEHGVPLRLDTVKFELSDGCKHATVTFLPPPTPGYVRQQMPLFEVAARGVTLCGNITLRVRGHTALSMADCSLDDSARALVLCDGASALLQSTCLRRCGTAITATTSAQCRLHECKILDAKDVCIEASCGAAVAASGCQFISTGAHSVHVSTGARLDIGTSEVTAASVPSAAVEVAGAACAAISASRITGETYGAACIAGPPSNGRGSLLLSDSAVRGGRCGVRAGRADVEARHCRVQGGAGPAVAAQHACDIRITDSTLRSGGRSALDLVRSRVNLQRNTIACRGGPGTAAMHMNRMRVDSVLRGNTVIADPPPEHHIVFAFASAADRQALQRDSALLQHPRLAECDVLRVQCAAHGRHDMLVNTPARIALVLWLRELGAHEGVPLGDAAAVAAEGAAVVAAACLAALRMLRRLVESGSSAVTQMLKAAGEWIRCNVVELSRSAGRHAMQEPLRAALRAAVMVSLVVAAAAGVLGPLDATPALLVASHMPSGEPSTQEGHSATIASSDDDQIATWFLTSGFD